MCKNCNENEGIFYFLMFSTNHDQTEEFTCCDACLCEVVEKLDSQGILYVFDRIEKAKTKRLH